MSSPIAIPRSNQATTSSASSSYSSVASSSSSPATSYPSSPNTQAKYVPIHKRSASPPHSPKVASSSAPEPEPSRTYSIHHLLSLRTHAHAQGYTDSVKATLRAGPAPELVMNRKMRKNLEFAEHHHRRVSPTSSVNASPVAKTTALPPVVVVAVPTQTQSQTPVTPTTKFSGRASHPHSYSQQTKRQPLGGLQSNLANWRTPVPPRLAVN